MNGLKIIIPVALGAAIVGSVFVSVPPENRRIEWPILGTLTGITAVIGIIMLRQGFPGIPTAES